jgi:hypothetical protein
MRRPRGSERFRDSGLMGWRNVARLTRRGGLLDAEPAIAGPCWRVEVEPKTSEKATLFLTESRIPTDSTTVRYAIFLIRAPAPLGT